MVNLYFSSQISLLKVTLLFAKLYIGKQHQNRALSVHLRFTINTLFSFFFLIEVQLIYNIILVSGIQHNVPVLYRLYSIKSYDKIMAMIPCAVHFYT